MVCGDFMGLGFGKEPHHSVHVLPHRDSGCPGEKAKGVLGNTKQPMRTGVQVSRRFNCGQSPSGVLEMGREVCRQHRWGPTWVGSEGHARRFNLYFAGNGNHWKT